MKTNSTHPCYEAHDKAAAGKCQSEVDQDFILSIIVILININIVIIINIVIFIISIVLYSIVSNLTFL